MAAHQCEKEEFDVFKLVGSVYPHEVIGDRKPRLRYEQ